MNKEFSETLGRLLELQGTQFYKPDPNDPTSPVWPPRWPIPWPPRGGPQFGDPRIDGGGYIWTPWGPVYVPPWSPAMISSRRVAAAIALNDAAESIETPELKSQSMSVALGLLRDELETITKQKNVGSRE